ncbi:MAG: hypothetical protein GM46_7310 [actinobacterium acAcidi]|nr:MAG: hypothetical protein GM46_7310 [actinobacterium acAcidi]
MDQYSARLLEISDRVVPQWVERVLQKHCDEHMISDLKVGDHVSSVVARVGNEVHTNLLNLLSLDVLEQRTNPLAIFRQATRPISDLLKTVGCAPVVRDEFDERSFPDDIFGLCPATWVDIDEMMVEPGIEWGAWKAATVMMRKKKQ